MRVFEDFGNYVDLFISRSVAEMYNVEGGY